VQTMNKTTAGFVLVGGLAAVAVGWIISATATAQASTPGQDWFYDLINYFGIAVILAGLGMFFFGSLRFARKD
jgi:hypothetical protein